MNPPAESEPREPETASSADEVQPTDSNSTTLAAPADASNSPTDRTESFELDAAGTEAQPARSPWLGPLVMVPAGLVLAAVGLYMFMNWMVSEPYGPEDHLQQLVSSGYNSQKQAFHLLVVSLQNYKQDGRLSELPPDFDQRLAAAFDEAPEDGAMVRIALAGSLAILESDLAYERLVQMVRDARASGGEVEPATPLESLDLVETGQLNPLTNGILWLGQLGDARAVPLLSELLDESDAGVRMVSAAALGNIDDDSIIPPLQGALEDADRETRRNAAISLAKHGDRSGMAVLIEMLNPSTYQGYNQAQPIYQERAMIFALLALAELRAEEARPQVEELAEMEGEVSLKVVSEARKWLDFAASGWKLD